MAGIGTRTATVEANGKTYTLKIGCGEAIALEELLSTDTKHVSLPHVIAHMGTGSVTHFRAFIWAALRKHHPEFTLEAVNDFIDEVGADVLTEAINKVVDSTQPDQEDMKELGVDSSRPPRARAKKRGGTGGVFTSMHGASA